MTTGFSIAAAVQAAAPGSQLVIPSGRYHESVSIDKPLTLVGDGSNREVRIDPPSGSSITVYAQDTTIREIKIVSSKSEAIIDVAPGAKLILEDSELDGGTVATSSSPVCMVIRSRDTATTVRRCRIQNGRVGVIIDGDSQPTITDCVVVGNAENGIVSRNGAKPVISSCQIRDNALFGDGFKGTGDGIRVDDDSAATITHCDIHNNKGGGAGISVGRKAIVRAQHCHIYDNGEANVSFTMEGNGYIEDCEISGRAAWSIYIGSNACPSIRRCRIHDGPAFGIWIATHRSHAISDAQARIEDCAIYGMHEGISIERAWPWIVGCNIHHNDSGIYIRESSHPSIYRCVIHHNKAFGIIVGEDDCDGDLYESEVHSNGTGSIERKGDARLSVFPSCRIED